MCVQNYRQVSDRQWCVSRETDSFQTDRCVSRETERFASPGGKDSCQDRTGVFPRETGRCVPQRDRQTDRQTLCASERQTDRQTDAVCFRETDRQTDAVCFRETDRQTDRRCVPPGDPAAALLLASQLISLGADVSLRSRWTSMNALHYAAYFDVPQLIRVLLRAASPRGTHIRTHTHTHTRTHARTRTLTRIQTHTHAHTHTHEYRHIRTHAHRHTHSRTRTLTHAGMHTRTHTHTHSHACTCVSVCVYSQCVLCV